MSDLSLSFSSLNLDEVHPPTEFEERNFFDSGRSLAIDSKKFLTMIENAREPLQVDRGRIWSKRITPLPQYLLILDKMLEMTPRFKIGELEIILLHLGSIHLVATNALDILNKSEKASSNHAPTIRQMLSLCTFEVATAIAFVRAELKKIDDAKTAKKSAVAKPKGAPANSD